MYAVPPLLRGVGTWMRCERRSNQARCMTMRPGTRRRGRSPDAASRTRRRWPTASGAHHHDLNVKNVLFARSSRGGSPVAYVLDVDRVEFGRPGDSRVTERNLDRFMRSARKWRDLHGARVEEAELVRVAASVRRLVSSRPSSGARARTRS